ncbi:MAG: AraC family transcriptional regulator [Bacteroidota bacterium]
MIFRGKNEEFFEVGNFARIDAKSFQNDEENVLTLIWFEDDQSKLIIDAKPHHFKKDTILCLSNFNKVEIEQNGEGKLLRFNKSFYCILNHDQEVGCKGILFFGGSEAPIIQPSMEELDILETVWKMLTIEMTSRDNLQLEMLQMMLKRILILCTRIYKSQNYEPKRDISKDDVVREFNFLVETHFKEKFHVADYADMLHRTPKALANLFKKVSSKSPLQIIKERRIIEAKRLLTYTDQTVSEVGYHLGFKDVQTFSRFFKKEVSMSPVEFRNS